MKGSIVAIAFGLWCILAPRSVIWVYGSLLGGRMESATPGGVRVAGGIVLLLVVMLVTLIQTKVL